MGAEILIIVAVLMLSVILHEVAHGFMAYSLGDPTAKHAGRLTLNPLPHVDLIGTILVPLILFVLSAGFLFGWAKPVPYNPYNLRGRYGEALVAAAGPLTNIGLALVAGLLYRLFVFPEFLMDVLLTAVFVNLFLALLNLLPLPTLDGATIVSSILPPWIRLALEEKIARVVDVNSILFMIVALLFVVFFLIDYLVVAVSFLTVLVVG